MNLTVKPLPPSLADGAEDVRIDPDGGRPLRCCLRESRPGERIALVLVTPEGPVGAYAESGPVFLHADGCDGPAASGYPDEFRTRTQVFRAYGHDGTILGGEVVPGGGDSCQEAAAGRLLADEAVAFVQARNVVHGCYLLTLTR